VAAPASAYGNAQGKNAKLRCSAALGTDGTSKQGIRRQGALNFLELTNKWIHRSYESPACSSQLPQA
jgi:hypothetical protein